MLLVASKKKQKSYSSRVYVGREAAQVGISRNPSDSQDKSGLGLAWITSRFHHRMYSVHAWTVGKSGHSSPRSSWQKRLSVSFAYASAVFSLFVLARIEAQFSSDDEARNCVT